MIVGVKNDLRKKGVNKIDTIIDIYEMVLQKKIKKFPMETWNPYKSGYDNIHRCYRYLLLEKLKITRQEITKIDLNFVVEYKLWGGTKNLYGSIGKTIIMSIPEYNLEEWEFPRFEFDDLTASLALTKTIKNNDWDRGYIAENITVLIEKDSVFHRVHIWYKYCHGNGVLKMLQLLLPEYNFMYHDLTRVDKYQNEDLIRSIKFIIEEKLNINICINGLNEVDIKQIREELSKPLTGVFRNNFKKMIKLAYPSYDFTTK